MTVATTTNSYTYNGNGLTTVFAFNSVFLDAADLTVILTSSAGVETVQTITTHYTVSGGSGSTGSVTMVTAPASGEKLTIVRDPALTQTLDLVANDPLPAEELEQALDKAVMLLQRVAERIDRSVVIQDSDTGTLTLPVAADRANKYAAFDASGNLIASTGPSGDSTVPVSTFMETLLDDTTAAAARTTLGAITGADSTTFSGTNSFSGANTVSGSLNVTGTLTAAAAPLPRSWLAGLALSRDAGDTDHDIAIAVGAARDDTDAADLRLAATLTKQIDAAWAVGDDAGGMDSGTVANSTWYAVWLIRRSDTGVVDALFSTSGSSPTMPTNYDQKRRIGWVLTDGSANIRPFVQTGDRFEHLSPDGLTLDANGASVTTTESTVTVSNAPASSIAILNTSIRRSSEAAEARIYPTDVADAAVASTASPLPTVGGFSTGSSSNPIAYSTQMQIRLDSSQQIHARASTTGVTLYALAVGWIDRRGRDD